LPPFADAGRGQEETGVGRLRLRRPGRENREGRRDREEARAREIAGESGHLILLSFDLPARR
jgi:hypothetical protein